MKETSISCDFDLRGPILAITDMETNSEELPQGSNLMRFESLKPLCMWAHP